jgi:hypothetical protein
MKFINNDAAHNAVLYALGILDDDIPLEMWNKYTKNTETWPSGLRQQVANLSCQVIGTVSSNLTVSAKNLP